MAALESATISSPLVWCRAGSSRSAAKMAGTSDVPTTSGPSAAYSSAQGRDLEQADLVDLLRAGVDGGEEGRQLRVGRLSVREVHEPAPLVGPGLRRDLVAEHVAVALGRGPHLLLHDGQQPLAPAGGVHAGRRVLHREHRVVLDRPGQPRVELLHGLPDREVGGRATGRDPLAVPLGDVVEVAGDALELGDHRLGDVGVRHRELGHVDAQAGLRPEDRVGRELRRAGLQQVGPRRGLPHEHRTGDPFAVVQALLVDGLRSCGECPSVPDRRVLAGPADVVEAVGVAVLTDHVGPGGRRPQPEVVVGVGQPVELVVRVRHRTPAFVRGQDSPSFPALSSRIWTLRILPVTVIGNSSTTMT